MLGAVIPVPEVFGRGVLGFLGEADLFRFDGGVLPERFIKRVVGGAEYIG